MNHFDFLQQFPENGHTMPTLFMGHGSPMNGIEDNAFSRHWHQIAQQISVPTAILVVSAHWLTRGTHITAMEFPRTIHDFGGFPRALYEVQYPTKGSPVLAEHTQQLIQTAEVGLDHEWGLDHGAWTIVRHMYPEANIPVLQLSIDYGRDLAYHYDLAKELQDLRKRGVLIIGSGNMVHNLRMVAWDKLNEPEYGFDWAHQMNTKFKQAISNRDHQSLIHYSKWGKEALMAIPTPDHYIPLLYTLGLQNENEEATFFNDKAVGGSLTMTSVLIQ